MFSACLRSTVKTDVLAYTSETSRLGGRSHFFTFFHFFFSLFFGSFFFHLLFIFFTFFTLWSHIFFTLCASRKSRTGDVTFLSHFSHTLGPQLFTFFSHFGSTAAPGEAGPAGLAGWPAGQPAGQPAGRPAGRPAAAQLASRLPGTRPPTTVNNGVCEALRKHRRN